MKLDKLSTPFPENKIHWRVGATSHDKTKGIALAYIDARDAMERLDEVCGPENWQCRYPFVGCCEIGIKLNGEWVWKSNGAGVTDYEAEKGQYSDAFKRAGVLWGIGRYLYDLPNTWCRIEQKGKSYVLAETPNLPQWAKPGAYWTSSQKQEFHEQVQLCMDNNDENGLKELFGELEQDEKIMIWNTFTSQQRSLITDMMKEKR